MTIECKYKFIDQEKYKFQGKPYCTCFNELCEDLPPCDDNCQIFEDYKKLKEIEEIAKQTKDMIAQNTMFSDKEVLAFTKDKQIQIIDIVERI